MRALELVDGNSRRELKCANPACMNPDHLSGSGKFFRLETLGARECVTHLGSHGASVDTHPQLRIAKYWLCARCAEVCTLQYNHLAEEVIAVPRAPQHAHRVELDLEQLRKTSCLS